MPKSLAEAFDPRANSIGFLRWLMAFLVIFSHSGPLAGFYGGKDLGTQWSNEQSLGGVAVCGFFFFSGFLITKSRLGRSTTLRYFWRRALRILPAWWTALLLTAFILAPIAWIKETGSIAGFFGTTVDSPLTYFLNNMWLDLNQHNIAGMGSSLPFAQLHGGYDWNGSAWTLIWEFRGYILVGLLGMVGGLANRWVAGIVASAILAFTTLQWLYAGDLTRALTLFSDQRGLLVLAPFALGILFALFGEKIPIDDRLAAGGFVVALASYAFGGWLVFGQYAFCYSLMWFAVRVKGLRHWERFGDFSYGIYIFAWPLMQFSAYFGLPQTGWLVYHVVIVIGVHILAFLSWHLIEKPAMSLKNWTPAPLAWLLARWAPLSARLKRRLVNPDFSSTAYARQLRLENAAAPSIRTDGEHADGGGPPTSAGRVPVRDPIAPGIVEPAVRAADAQPVIPLGAASGERDGARN